MRPINASTPSSTARTESTTPAGTDAAPNTRSNSRVRPLGTGAGLRSGRGRHARDPASRCHQRALAREEIELEDLVGRHASAEEEALSLAAAVFHQDASLLLGLDTFRVRAHAEVLRELDDGPHHHQAAR